MVLASFGANLLSLAVPMAMIQIYDRVIPNQGHETLIVLGAVVFTAILADVLLRSARRYILERAGERFELAAYPAAVRALVLSDPARDKRVSEGDLYHRLTGIDRLRNAHSGETSTALLDLPFALLFLAVVILISPQAGLTIFCVLAAAFVVLKIARQRVLKLQLRRQDNEARRHSFLTETLRELDAVKGMRSEGFMQRRYERLLAGAAATTQDTARSVQLAQGFTAAIGTLSPLLMGSIGAMMVIEGQMTVGGLAAVILLTSRIIQPILRVEAFLAGMANQQKDREELEDILAAPQIADGPRPLPRIDRLQLDQVTTDPGPEGGLAFRNVSLTLERGDCLALEGPDSTSRSAFLRLIAGEMALQQGEILLNDVPLFQHRLEDRQTQIRLLGPANGLIEGSLIENMTMFRPRTYRDRAVQLAQTLDIESDITLNPEGFDLRLRSGADTRLPKSLADAALIVGGLVSEPGLLLFDQANAALDRKVDGKLLEVMEQEKADRITILVSNRPSFVRMANKRLDITPFLQAPRPRTRRSGGPQ
ncbi:MAG: ABC transporter transmembrane domain-containing protein [Silicimonas sp.]|nr:ABC transporter transmembrane domain-containing protein [Silicimonas sp.]